MVIVHMKDGAQAHGVKHEHRRVTVRYAESGLHVVYERSRREQFYPWSSVEYVEDVED